MPAFDLYGILNEDLKTVKSWLENTLEIAFAKHESYYKGGEYYFAGARQCEHFELQKNLDLLDGEPAELEFGEYPTLLYVNCTNRSDLIRELLKERIPGCKNLKHEYLE